MQAAGIAQEGSQGSGERGDLVQLPPREACISEMSDPCSPRALTFDLLNMVISFKRMVIFLEPINDGLDLARFLLGWRMPVCSLFCCVVLNVLFLTLSQVAWFSLCLLGISTPATLGYLQDRSQSKSSEASLQRRKHHSVQRRDLQTVHLTRQEAMLEVKGLLKQLDVLLSQACVSAESVYKVLYWESQLVSSLFYGGLLTLLCLLYTAPLGWVLAALNSALFLWNRDFCRVLLEKREIFRQGRQQPAEREVENAEPELAGFLDQTPTPNSVEDFSPGSIEEAEEAEPDDEFKDAIEEAPPALPETPLGLVARPAERQPELLWEQTGPPACAETKEDEDVAPGASEFDNGLLSRNEPIRSKVSKLTEKLRKRYPANATGNCSNCSAVFSVLRKRRSCSSCGNSYCSRCCSYKVLKSCMGATGRSLPGPWGQNLWSHGHSPEAQRESVFVCGTCYLALSKKE